MKAVRHFHVAEQYPSSTAMVSVFASKRTSGMSGDSSVGRFRRTKLPIGSQLELVLADFGNLASSEPVGNRRRLNSANSCDLGLGPKVFKKVIRCHGSIVSHALRNTQAISNNQRDKVEGMTSWHNRLDFALTHRGKTWADLFDHMNHSPAKLKKPSVYAWKPNATKRSTMMDASNAAIVCKFLGITPMWLFHNEGTIDDQEHELLSLFRQLKPKEKSILLIGLKMSEAKRYAYDVVLPSLLERGDDRRQKP